MLTRAGPRSAPACAPGEPSGSAQRGCPRAARSADTCAARRRDSTALLKRASSPRGLLLFRCTRAVSRLSRFAASNSRNTASTCCRDAASARRAAAPRRAGATTRARRTHSTASVGLARERVRAARRACAVRRARPGAGRCREGARLTDGSGLQLRARRDIEGRARAQALEAAALVLHGVELAHLSEDAHTDAAGTWRAAAIYAYYCITSTIHGRTTSKRLLGAGARVRYSSAVPVPAPCPWSSHARALADKGNPPSSCRGCPPPLCLTFRGAPATVPARVRSAGTVGRCWVPLSGTSSNSLATVW